MAVPTGSTSLFYKLFGKPTSPAAAAQSPKTSFLDFLENFERSGLFTDTSGNARHKALRSSFESAQGNGRISAAALGFFDAHAQLIEAFTQLGGNKPQQQSVAPAIAPTPSKRSGLG